MNRLGQNRVHGRFNVRDAVKAQSSYVNQVEHILLNVFYPPSSSSKSNVCYRALVPESQSMCKTTK